MDFSSFKRMAKKMGLDMDDIAMQETENRIRGYVQSGQLTITRLPEGRYEIRGSVKDGEDQITTSSLVRGARLGPMMEKILQEVEKYVANSKG